MPIIDYSVMLPSLELTLLYILLTSLTMNVAVDHILSDS